NGAGIAAAMLFIARRLPAMDSEEATPASRWTDAAAVAFLLLAIPFLNLRKDADEWVTARAVPAALYGLPVGWWFDAAYAVLAAVVIAALLRHLRHPLPIIPATWYGKGQLLYLVFLWWVVVGNFERAIVAFAPQRLVTEGVIH